MTSARSSERTAGWARLLASAGAATAFGLFVAINAAYVVDSGVCCADDSSFAIVAKNLAWGKGYSLSVGYSHPTFSVRPFDGEVGTGPALILPVSLAIRIFGNRPWVPGAVQVAIWSLLLLAIWRSLRRILDPFRVDIGSAMFLGAAYAVSPYHFEQWYAMLGEVPAALAVLLAGIVWASHPGSRRAFLLAGTLLSFAVLTKVLMLIYALALVAVATVTELIDDHEDAGRPWGRLALLACGLMGPVALFEGWKLVALGANGYQEHLASLWHFASHHGFRARRSPTELTERLLLFDARFGVALSSLLIAALVGSYLGWRSRHARGERLLSVVGAGVLAHTAYWLTVGVNWPRYFYPGLVLLCALVVLPVATMRGRIRCALYGVVLGLAFLGTMGRASQPVLHLGHRWFAPGELRVAQDHLVAFIDARPDRRPLVTQWWASIADLEYLSRNVLNFKRYEALTPDDAARGFFLVTNRRFDRPSDLAFVTLVARCGPPVLSAEPFAVHACGGNVLGEPQPLP